MTQFVVMVRGVDDTYDGYGPVRSEQRAQTFADWFNAKVEAYEAENSEDADGSVWAYVMPLRTLRSSVMLENSGLPNGAA